MSSSDVDMAGGENVTKSVPNKPLLATKSVTAPKKGSKHACERCRKSKLRCLVDTVKEHGKCRRCVEAKAGCEFFEMAPRQRRKRTDARVVLLEKQIADFKARLDGTGTTAASGRNSSRKSPNETIPEPKSLVHKKQVQTPVVGLRPHNSRRNVVTARCDETDVLYTIPGYVEASLLSFGNAELLFNSFITYALPEHPLIGLSNQDDFYTMRERRPLLTFAVIIAAATVEDPSLSDQLHDRIFAELIQKTVKEGHRNVEIILTVLVMKTWYRPPNEWTRMNFYVWTHIAVTMAVQMGLGGHDGRPPRDLQMLCDKKLSPLQMENFRTRLAVYLSASFAATSLRRHCIVSFTNTEKLCLELFEQNATTTNDHFLAASIRIQLIAEDIEKLRIQLDKDRDQNQTPKLLGKVHLIDQDLADWAQLYPAELANESARIYYHHIRSKLYELGTFPTEVAAALILPCIADPHAAPILEEPWAAPDSGYSRALQTLVRCYHGTLDAILQMSIQKYLYCPTVNTVRALHALKALLILNRCVTMQRRPVCLYVDEAALAFDSYAEKMQQFLKIAAGSSERKLPMIMLSIIEKIMTKAKSKFPSRRPDQCVPTSTGQVSIDNIDDDQAQAADSTFDAEYEMAQEALLPDVLVGDSETLNSYAGDSGTLFNLSISADSLEPIPFVSELDTLSMPDFGVDWLQYTSTDRLRDFYDFQDPTSFDWNASMTAGYPPLD